MKHTLHLLLCFLLSGQLLAQSTRPDSLIGYKRDINRIEFKESLLATGLLATTGLVAFTRNGYIDDDKVHQARDEKVPNFTTKVDDYLPILPVLAVYGLNFAGVTGRHNFGNRTLLLAKAELFTMAIVYPTKYAVGRLRPDESEYDSFPSGHTAQAFMAATFMHKEYGHQSIWYSATAYATASTVAAMRVLNDRHYLSDVMFGAGVGIFATNLAYLTHQYRWFTGEDQNFTLVPSYSGSRPGLYMSFNF